MILLGNKGSSCSWKEVKFKAHLIVNSPFWRSESAKEPLALLAIDLFLGAFFFEATCLGMCTKPSEVLDFCSEGVELLNGKVKSSSSRHLSLTVLMVPCAMNFIPVTSQYL